MAAKSTAINSVYRKGTHPTGGIKYEADLQTLFALSGIKFFEHDNWKLSNNNEDAKKFDDLVFELDQGDILLQAKTKTKKVTDQHFLSDNPKADFSLAKYILSHKSTQKFKPKYLLLCTNADIQQGLLKLATNNNHEMIRNIFGEHTLYSIDQIQKAKLMENIIQFKSNINLDKHDAIIEWKNLDITQDDIDSFISKFFCIKVSEKQIETEIRLKLKQLQQHFPLPTYEYVTHQVQQWYDMKKGFHLTNTHIKLILYEEESRDAVKRYLNQPISFSENQFQHYNTFIIKADIQYDWYLTTILNSILKNSNSDLVDKIYDEILFIAHNSFEIINNIIECFKLPKLKYLIVCFTELTEKQMLEVCRATQNVLQSCPYKKVFIFATNPQFIHSNLQGGKIIKDPICVNSLDSNSRQKLFDTQILFQGNLVNFKELVSCDKIMSKIDETIIRKLLESEKYSVGGDIKNVDNGKSYYITRNLSIDKQSFSEEEWLSKIQHSIVILSGPPGCGKTYLLKNLINKWKIEKPLTWIINLDISKTIDCFNKHGNELTLWDLLIETENVKFSFEQELLTYLEKIIIIDGIDETYSHNMEQLQTLLAKNKNLNTFTIIMATRNYDTIIKKLEAEHLKMFVLKPFSEEHQLQFLEEYIKSKETTDIDLTNVVNLFRELSAVIPDIKDFCRTPLSLKMIIDILSINENNLQLLSKAFSKKIGKYEFYKYFLDEMKKKFVTQNCKCLREHCPQCVILKDAFNGYLNDLTILAARSLFSSNMLDSFDTDKHVNLRPTLLQVGVLDENFEFLHKSFEEYFGAQYIWNIFFQKQLTNPKLLNILNEIFMNIQYSGVSDFFNGILGEQKTLEKNLIFDVSKKYSHILEKVEWNENKNILNLAFHGHINIIKMLFEQYEKFPDVINIRGASGQTALHLSAHYPDLVKYLTEKRADVNCLDDNMYNIFHYIIMMCWDSEKYKLYYNAISEKTDNFKYLKSTIFLEEFFKLRQEDPLYGYRCKTNYNDILDLIKYLQGQGLNLQVKDKDGHSPIHWVAHSGFLKILVYFTEECQMDINVYNIHKHSPLHYACQFGAIDTVKYLLNQGSDLNELDKNNCSVVHMAALGNAENVLTYLVDDCKKDLNTKDKFGSTPHHYAAINGSLDAMKYLKAKGLNLIDTNDVGVTLAHMAAHGNAVNILKFLKDADIIDPSAVDVDGLSPLHNAALKGSLEAIKYLKSIGFNLHVVSKDGITLGHLAAYGNAISCLKYLIEECGIDPTVPNKRIGTYLHWAALNGSFEAAQYLVEECNVDLFNTNINGDAALHFAAGSESLNLVKYLISKGINLKSINNTGLTPIHRAAEKNRINILKFLVEEHNIDPSIVDEFGNNPLHTAAVTGSFDAAQYLIEECNIDAFSTNIYKDTALHLAAESESLDLVKYLISKGINKINNNGSALINRAAEKNRINILKYLVEECKIDPSSADIFGNTPLHDAAGNGSLEVVKYLIEDCNLDPNNQNIDGNTTLHLTAQNKPLAYLNGIESKKDIFLINIKQKCVERSTNCINILKYLIEKCNMNPSIINKFGETSLHKAAESDSIDAIMYMVENCNVELTVPNNFDFTALYVACQHGSLKAVKYFESRGMRTDVANGNGSTLVHVAAMGNAVNCLKYLIEECKIDPTLSNKVIGSPLHDAAQAGSFEAAQYLIEECNINVMSTNINGDTALHFAAGSESLNLVKYLISKGINPNVLNNNSSTPVNLAAKYNQIHILKYLVEYCKIDPSSADKCGNTPLHDAAGNGSLKVLKYLIEDCKADPNKQNINGNTTLHFAAYNENLAYLKYIESKKEKNVNSFNKIYVEGSKNCLNILKYLIEKCNMDPSITNKFGNTSLHVAAINGSLDAMQYLIEYCNLDPSTPNKTGYTALHFAAENRHLEAVIYLNSTGMRMDISDESGITPIHSAAFANAVNVLKYLIEDCNLDPTTSNKSGYNSLYFAAKAGSLDILKYLESKGLCLKYLSQDGTALIHIAASANSLNILKYLVEECRIDPTVVNKNGKTPLHFAAESGSVDVIRYLIEDCQLDPTTVDIFQCTALDYILENGSREARRYLENWFQNCN